MGEYNLRTFWDKNDKILYFVIVINIWVQKLIQMGQLKLNLYEIFHFELKFLENLKITRN